MADDQEANAVPDFTLIFTKMREATTPDIAENVALVESQAETLRILAEAMPESDSPYVTTFLSV